LDDHRRSYGLPRHREHQLGAVLPELGAVGASDVVAQLAGPCAPF
jgi:hypothetical protein